MGYIVIATQYSGNDGSEGRMKWEERILRMYSRCIKSYKHILGQIYRALGCMVRPVED